MNLPCGWRKQTLVEVFPEVTVGFVGTVSNHYCDQTTGVTFYRTGNVRDGFFSHHDLRFVTPEFHRRNRKSAICNGDILIARVGANLGMVCKADGVDKEANAANVIIIKRNPEANSDFFSEFLRSRLGQSQISAGSVGGAQGVFNTRLAERIVVLVPPREEQDLIANCLLAWNSAIQKTEQLIAAKERHYSHELSRLISRGQHPHTHGGAFAEEVSARNSAGKWRGVALSEIAVRVQRQTDGGDYPLLTISSASGFIRQEDRYSRYMAGESAKTYTLLRAGEFSYNKGNSKRYEFGCVFQLQEFDAAMVPSVYVSFKLHDSVCASYMRHLFAADYLKPQLRALVKTGVRNNGLLNIRPDEFMGTKVPLPPLEQQLRIANYLDARSAEIALLKQKLAALRIQKRGLMQKLLTGQWRLSPSKEMPG
jgi:type I restriction enzyme S subunit